MSNRGFQVRGVGKWLQNAHRSMRRTEQELEVRGLLKCLGLEYEEQRACLLYTSPSPRDLSTSRMPSSA